MITPAFAQAPGGGGGADIIMSLVPFILIFVIMWFLIIRPQQKQARQQDDMRKAIKKGDKIVTTGGILGTVVGVKDKSLTIRSEETKFEILKSAVGQVVEDFDKADAVAAPTKA